jgi:RNA polymerase subunit RPABC4/transcription elongation factor Spt4
VNTAAGYALLYFFFPEIMLPIYLIRVASGRRQIEEQRKLAMQQHIAEMEAQLGIWPPTSGTCRACHKPLQVGAEFCQYCGVPVIERAKICPSCATTTLPEAKWCPKCGKPLA